MREVGEGERVGRAASGRTILLRELEITGEGANQTVTSQMVRCQVIKVKRRALPAGVEQRPGWIAPSLFFFQIQERA